MFVFMYEIFKNDKFQLLLMSSIMKDRKYYGVSQSAVNEEITELRTLVSKFLHENQQICKEIVERQPTFIHILYHPRSHLGGNQPFLRELLLKQIDNLMEENDFLLKKREQKYFSASQIQIQKNTAINKNITHFSVLRSAWSRFTDKNVNTPQKIDNLNKVVGMIKQNINQLMKSEDNQLSQYKYKDLRSFNDQMQIDRMKEKIQMLLMRNEDINAKYCQLQQKVQKKNVQIQRLEEEIEKIKNQVTKSFEALCSSRQKIDCLENQKCLFESKIDQLKKKSESNIIFTGNDFQIKIVSEKKQGTDVKIMKISKKLEEIIDFIQNGNHNSSEIFVPLLDLNLESKQKPKGETERIKTCHNQKFIPMRTQRIFLNKSMRTTNGSGSDDIQELPSPKKFNRAPLTNNNRSKINNLINFTQRDSL